MLAPVWLLALAGDYNVPRWPPTYNMSLSTIIMPCVPPTTPESLWGGGGWAGRAGPAAGSEEWGCAAGRCDNNELMSSGPNWPIIRDFGVIDIDVSSPPPHTTPTPPAAQLIQRRGLSGAQWSNSKEEWINTEPMTCEENLLKQAQLIKAKNPLGKGQKVWVRTPPPRAAPRTHGPRAVS